MGVGGGGGKGDTEPVSLLTYQGAGEGGGWSAGTKGGGYDVRIRDGLRERKVRNECACVPYLRVEAKGKGGEVGKL